MQLSLVLIAVDLGSKRQRDGVLGGWCNIFTCTIFHYPINANVNTCPIHVCSLDFAVHAKMIDVLHRDFLWTGKWELIRMLHRTFMQKFEVFKDSTFSIFHETFESVVTLDRANGVNALWVPRLLFRFFNTNPDQTWLQVILIGRAVIGELYATAWRSSSENRQLILKQLILFIFGDLVPN